jgi:hypothetical protein
MANCAKSIVTRGGGWRAWKGYVAPEVTVTVAGMDKSMSLTTRKEVLKKLRRRYSSAGLEHKRKLLDEAQELLGYHRKAAIRALRASTIERGPRMRIITGRPVAYEPELLLPYLRPIWRAADYACGRRLVAMLPEWIPAYEQHERKIPAEVRDKLMEASGRTLDRLLEPLRVQGAGRCLTRPGTLLRQQIPIRGNVWEEGTAGWLEVDTVALCGGSVAGEFVWMVDGVDYATTWVEIRAMWGRGQVNTLAALRDMEADLPFPLLGLDSDNGGEFINHHVLRWLQKRPNPVFMTRSRPYKKDDNAHVEQKNWTHVRQCFGYERHDNSEVVELINTLIRKAYGPLRNFFHASLKLESKERTPGVPGCIKRVYGKAQTPLTRVLASAQVSDETKQRLKREKALLNPFALQRLTAQGLKEIAAVRQLRP